MRENGVLLPIFALPSEYGIGCFSKEAYAFVDTLKRAGQRWWQILPLGPTGYGDSPYQSFSTFAGNPYFINLEQLKESGLLTKEELESEDFGEEGNSIDYEKLYHARSRILFKAFKRFRPLADSDYAAFLKDNEFWLDDYCAYMAIKDKYDGKPWTKWDEPLRKREPGAMRKARLELEEEINFYRFQQFIFWRHWCWLHSYANANGIGIIGDIPIYVAFDSADTWANPDLFQFDEDMEPIAVAGCPPDGYAAKGQLWGNPLYRWDYHKSTGYAWWMKRISYCMRQYDMLRIDHFRGFESYYSVPYGDEDASGGHWEEGPGIDFFDTLKKEIGAARIIAEDLGFLTESVRDLVKQTGYPGMKVLEFAFDSSEASDYLPYHYDNNCVVYTGTHDNDTIQGWYRSLNEHDRNFSIRYMNNGRTPVSEIHMDFVRLAMSSVADLCIVPIQDLMGLGHEARINEPSTLGGNWKWRLAKGQLPGDLSVRLRELTRIYGRL